MVYMHVYVLHTYTHTYILIGMSSLDLIRVELYELSRGMRGRKTAFDLVRTGVLGHAYA